MATKINVGVNKKVGLPDYGSAGAHCELEIEVDHSILNDPHEFQKRIRYAYELARESVEMELREISKTKKENPSDNFSQQQEHIERPEKPVSHGSNARALATPKQMEFIGRLSRGIKGLNTTRLDQYCQRTFGKAYAQISTHEASRLIDLLKEARAGKEMIA